MNLPLANASSQVRPAVHFTPEFGWINDPNGLIYYEGEYHLFYQFHPYDLLWGPMHWGHAVSTDLVHWTHLPIALFPDENGTIFSGSVVADPDNCSGLVPGGGLVAIFSFDTQAQGIAFSRDRGRTWTKYADNPVIASPGRDFRDPKVFWYAPDRCWVMTLVAGDHAEFYRSPNLIDWKLSGTFGAPYGARGGVWECPDLFPLDLDGMTKWVLIISVGDGAHAGGSGTQYFIGDFDGATFRSDNPAEVVLWLDFGADNYAGVTYNDTPDGRRLFIGWMNNWKYARTIPAETWRGSMTTPRALTLKHVQVHGVRLVQQPVREVELLRTPVAHLREKRLDAAGSSLKGLGGFTLDIEAEFCASDDAEFCLILDGGNGARTSIRVDTAREILLLDRRDSGVVAFHEGFATIQAAPLPIADGRVHLRVLLDASSIEVFANDGITTVTAQIFHRAHEFDVSLSAAQGSVTVESLDVYRLDTESGLTRASPGNRRKVAGIVR